MGRIRKEELGRLFEPSQAAYTCTWGLADRYSIFAGTIYPDPQDDDIAVRHPLTDPDLLLSFVRLEARGKPSEQSIKRWVSQHGLLTRKDQDQSLPYFVNNNEKLQLNQAPMSVDDFTKEVRCASQLLRLIFYIQEDHHQSILEMFVRASRRATAHVIDGPVTELDEMLARFYLNSSQVSQMLPGSPAWVNDPHSLSVYLAASAVMNVLQRKMSGIQVNFSQQLFAGPTPKGSDFKPLHSWYCPDLLTALYLQLYLWLTDHRPLRECESCPTLFMPSRKDKRYCGTSCRVAADRARKKYKNGSRS